MLLESLKELEKDFVFGALARLDIWMHPSIVTSLNVFQVQDSILIVVYLSEGFDTDLGPEVVHWSHNDSDELVEVDLTIISIVKTFEQSCNIFCFNINTEIMNSLVELVGIKTA